MTTKLSIIIPVYDCEKFLKKCLNSICKQVRKNVEVIIVNDCSTDGSNKICKSFTKKYNFVRLINLKKNKGAGHCRDIGIRIAAGDYISFVDSDDRLLNGSIGNILNHIKNFYGKEVFILRYVDSIIKKASDLNIDKNFNFSLKQNKENKSLVDYIKNFDLFLPTCWLYVVKKKFLHLNNINFKNIRLFEDLPFVSQILCLTKSFKFIEKPSYVYNRSRTNNLSFIVGYMAVISDIKSIERIGLFINKKKEFLNKSKIKFLFSILRMLIQIILANILVCKLNEIKKVSKYLYKYNLIFLKLSNFGFKKIDFFLQKDKIIYESLLEYKSKKIEVIKKKFEKLRYSNIILFCAGKSSLIISKILISMGAKITNIIDNNHMFFGKKLNNIIIKNPLYLKKNLDKFSNYKILVCHSHIKPINTIKLQLNKIGIRGKNISHINLFCII